MPGSTATVPTVHTTRASAVVWRLRDLAKGERGLRRGEKGITPHRDRRGSGVRGLADEPQHVALDAERPEHDAGGLVHRLEHRALLDVQLEIRVRVDRLQLGDARRACDRARRRCRAARREARCPACRPARARRPLQAAAGGRGSEQAAPETRALFVGPVDDSERPAGRCPQTRHRSAASPASTPSAPSSQPPFGTESRWPPIDDGLRAVARGRTQLLPAASVSTFSPSGSTVGGTTRARRATSVPTRSAARPRRCSSARPAP